MLKYILILTGLLSFNVYAEDEDFPIKRTSELIKEACRNLKYQCKKDDISYMDRHIQSCEIIMATDVCKGVASQQDYRNRLRQCDIASICSDAMVFEPDLWKACYNGFVDGQSEKISKYKAWLNDKLSKSSSQQQLLSEVDMKLGYKYDQVQCLDRKSRIEMYCWGSAYLTDPAILTYGVTQKAWGAIQNIKLISK